MKLHICKFCGKKGVHPRKTANPNTAYGRNYPFICKYCHRVQ